MKNTHPQQQSKKKKNCYIDDTRTGLVETNHKDVYESLKKAKGISFFKFWFLTQ